LPDKPNVTTGSPADPFQDRFVSRMIAYRIEIRMILRPVPVQRDRYRNPTFEQIQRRGRDLGRQRRQLGRSPETYCHDSGRTAL